VKTACGRSSSRWSYRHIDDNQLTTVTNGRDDKGEQGNNDVDWGKSSHVFRSTHSNRGMTEGAAADSSDEHAAYSPLWGRVLRDARRHAIRQVRLRW
jgi:hypothetical protein